jgi:hypothetical protein
MKKRKLVVSPVHVSTLKLFKAPQVIFYTAYRHYFLGDKPELNVAKAAHIDLSTQSADIGAVSPLKPALRAAKSLQKFTFGATLCYYWKLRFTGKGYKIKKTKLKKSFKLYFGRSHFQYIFSGGLSYKKLSKYRLLLRSNNKKKLNRVMRLTLTARPLNNFTKRGLRCTRQFILKRPGKKSTY